jgi:septal ring-binding cell division protein DamX
VPVFLDKRVLERDFQGTLTVQIAALLSRESAERGPAEAKARTGLQGVVYPPIGQKAQWYVMYLGSFTSVETAEEAIQLIRPRQGRSSSPEAPYRELFGGLS